MKEYEVTMTATLTYTVSADNETEAQDKADDILDMRDFEIIDRSVSEVE